jgi:hypothetical protein
MMTLHHFVLVCPICFVSSAGFRAAQLHLVVSHNLETAQLQKWVEYVKFRAFHKYSFPCPDPNCCISFRSRSLLEDHFVEWHTIASNGSDPPQCAPGVNTPIAKECDSNNISLGEIENRPTKRNLPSKRNSIVELDNEENGVLQKSIRVCPPENELQMEGVRSLISSNICTGLQEELEDVSLNSSISKAQSVPQAEHMNLESLRVMVHQDSRNEVDGIQVRRSTSPVFECPKPRADRVERNDVVAITDSDSDFVESEDECSNISIPSEYQTVELLFDSKDVLVDKDFSLWLNLTPTKMTPGTEYVRVSPLQFVSEIPGEVSGEICNTFHKKRKLKGLPYHATFSQNSYAYFRCESHSVVQPTEMCLIHPEFQIPEALRATYKITLERDRFPHGGTWVLFDKECLDSTLAELKRMYVECPAKPN